MKAIVFKGPKTTYVTEVPKPEPGPGQVLVKVRYVGICMSEYHAWLTAEAGARMGHEPMGVIEALGEGVTGLNVGQRVSGMSVTPCYAQYCLMRADRVVPVPDSLEDTDALAEPLACIVSVASKTPVLPFGQTVACVGTGYMGCGVLSILRLKGAGQIIAIDPRAEARDYALKFGATSAITPEAVPERMRLTEWEDIYSRGYHTVVEAAGTNESLVLAGDITAVHGTLCALAWHQGGNRSVDMRLWGWKGITLINTHERRDDFLTLCGKNALDMLERGLWDFKGTVTHVYAPDDFDRANEELMSKPDGYFKGVVKFD